MSENTFPEFYNETTYIYTYFWKMKFYDPTDSSVNVTPIKILGITKTCDYQTGFMPVVLLKCKIEKRDMFTLKVDKRNILASIVIGAKRYVRADATSTESMKEVGSDIISSGSFEVIFSPSSFDERYREEDYENYKNEDNTGHNTNVLETDTCDITVNLQDIPGIRTSKIIYNDCFKSGSTVGTILQYLVDTSCVKNAIVDKPDNQNSLPDVILPPGNFVATLNILQSIFGIYEHGLTAFYDNDILYVLNSYANEHDIVKGDSELSHVYITEADKDMSFMPLVSINDNGETMYAGGINTVVKDNEILSSELNGDNFVFSSFQQGLDAVSYNDGIVDSTSAKPVSMVLKRNLEAHSQSGDKNVLDYDELNNMYNMAAEFNRQEATSKPITIVLRNVDIMDFSPNKYIDIHFKDEGKEQRLGGVYFLLNATFSYAPANMQPTASMMSMLDDNHHVPNELQCGVVLTISQRLS